MSCQLAPPSVVISSTPPSNSASVLKLCQKLRTVPPDTRNSGDTRRTSFEISALSTGSEASASVYQAVTGLWAFAIDSQFPGAGEGCAGRIHQHGGIHGPVSSTRFGVVGIVRAASQEPAIEICTVPSAVRPSLSVMRYTTVSLLVEEPLCV